jgi:hypothetical protein
VITTTTTHPQQTTLTTLARFKAQLDIDSSADDAAYESLIAPASRIVSGCLGWEPYRGDFVDRFAGDGFLSIAVAVTPIVSLDAVALDGTAVSTADQAIAITNELGGVIQRAVGWSATTRPVWTVDYHGGWLVPADDFTATTATFANTGQTITLTGATWPLLVAGDRIAVSSSASNNGVFTVSARTSDTVLTLESGIADESAGATVRFEVSTLPADIERATVLLMRDAFSKRGSSATAAGPVKSIRTTGVAITYADSAALQAAATSGGAVSPDALALLEPYRRLP